MPNGFKRIRHYGFLSSSWKKEKLPPLQLELSNKDSDTIAYFEEVEKTVNRTFLSCKKGILITLFTSGNRGPPKNYKKVAEVKILEYKS